MAREAEEAGESVLGTLKQRVFASAFGSFDPTKALKQYYELFEKDTALPDEEELESYEPENEDDVRQMMNEVRRLGIIS